MKRDLLGILEAAYRKPAPTEQWASNVLDAAALLDDGLGVGVARVRVREDRLNFEDATTTMEAGLWRDFNTSPSIRTDHLQRALAGSGKTASMVAGRKVLVSYFGPIMERYGMADCIAVQGLLDPATCIGLYVPLREHRTHDRVTVQRLRFVGVHLASAYRANALGSSADEAWISPSGKVLDAHGGATAARERLTLRARAIEAARMRARRVDVDSALSVWQALVDGQWSLVENFDSDGKRYFVARRNEPRFGNVLRLTPREATIAKLAALGQSQKLIAYSLGLSASIVSKHLSSAVVKLGVGTVARLLELGEKLLRAE